MVYKEEKVDKDRIKNSHLNNEVTESNKLELQKWVLKFDSIKKEKIPLNSSKVVLHKITKPPLAKTQPKTIDKVSKPNFPQIKIASGSTPPGK